MSAVEDTVAALRSLNLQALQSEVDNLRAIKDWAMTQLGVDYKPGDRVVIVSSAPSSVERGSGWYHYREALEPGQTGTAGEITFNSSRKCWQVLVGMDRAWSVSTETFRPPTRYWSGPASETPDGYVAPSKFDQERYPEGKVKWFAMKVEWVARVES